MSGKVDRVSKRLLASVGALALAVAGAVGASTAQPTNAQATTINFNPGYIISDANFYNANALNQAQIQSFLAGVEPNCAQANGVACLKNYVATTTTRVAAAGGQCAQYTGATNEPASQIIYKVAQACGINPEVLIVTLQKEEGLVTAGSPTQSAYNKAMGYGCPDSSVCNTLYYGFYNQLYSAAWQFQAYRLNPSHFNHRVGNSTIAYSPNASCGSSVVNIQDQATAGLYNYTPYQPDAAALANLHGTGDSCSSYGNRNFWVYYNQWFGSPTGQIDPFGFLDSATAVVGGIAISGWAVDPDSADSLSVRVLVDGSLASTLTANVTRPDVAAAYPLAGPAHGYTAIVPITTSGNHTVCVTAVNVGPGADASLGCLTTPVLAGNPFGSADTLTVSGNTVTGWGWAIDPDTTDPVGVTMTLGGTSTTQLANEVRNDVNAVYPLFGPKHGFTVSATVSDGTYVACFTATNVDSGTDTTLACRDVVVGNGGATFADQHRAPIGSFDSASVNGTSIALSGWAIDQDTSMAISVQVTIDGTASSVIANAARPDVVAVYPAYGVYHGFTTVLASSPGAHTVCVSALNSGIGPAGTSLGCKIVSIPFPYGQFAQLSRAPIGTFDSAVPGAGTISVKGWSIDPDTSAAVQVQVSVDGTVTTATANGMRADVGTAYPGYGAAHGFDADVVAATGGKHIVCITAVNTGPGASSTSLGCKTVTLPAAPTELSRAPIGALDYAVAGAGAISVYGWAIDPDTAASIQVQIMIDGIPTNATAQVARPDVQAVFPGYGSAHGFLANVVVGPGTHTVCVNGLNSGAGTAQSALGCKTVAVPQPPSDLDRAPVGSLDTVTASVGSVAVWGWAIDPDTPAAIVARVTVDGVVTSATANSFRPDVEAAYPGYGESHGFSTSIAARSGMAHTVCVVAVNSGAGPSSSSLGCKTILVP